MNKNFRLAIQPINLAYLPTVLDIYAPYEKDGNGSGHKQTVFGKNTIIDFAFGDAQSKDEFAQKLKTQIGFVLTII